MDGLVKMLSNTYENVMDILCLIGSAIKHGYVDGKKVLFRAGERSDNFYIILEGEVSILMPQEVEMELTEEEYLDYLNTLRKIGENELVKKIINSNKLKDKLRHHNNHAVKSTSLLKSESMIEEKIVNNVVDNQKEKVRNYNLNEITNPKINDHSYDKRIPFHIWHYSYLGGLKAGDYFGDSGMTDSFFKRYIILILRTVTVVTEKQCHLGIVHKKIFDNFISEANVKNKLNLVHFLVGTDVFNGIEAGRFSKRYYNMFFEVRCRLSDKLLNSAESATDIFFIKDGEFELSMNANLKDIDRMVKLFNTDEIDENKERRNQITYKSIKIIDKR
jgi:CRP-like cAMP-binding protein